jgi:hypothetical protein
VAEQFNYTSSTGIVSPNSQPLKASPAKNAFDSVNNLISSATKGAVAYVNQQTLNLNSDLAVAKTDKALLDTQSLVTARSDAAIEKRLYLNNMTDAGTNIEAQAQATDLYQSRLRQLSTGQNLTVTAALQAQTEQDITATSATLLSNLQTRDKQDFTNAVSLTLPSMSAQTPEEQRATYDELLNLGGALGLTKEYVGGLMANGRLSYAIQSINEEELVLGNNGYQTIEALTAEIKAVEKLNPYNTDGIKAATAARDRLKNAVDTKVRADVADAKNTLNKTDHDAFLKRGLENKVYSKDQVAVEELLFTQKANSASNLAMAEAVSLTAGNRGVANPSLAASPATKAHIVTEAKRQSTVALQSKNAQQAKELSRQAGEQYYPLFKEFNKELESTVLQLAGSNLPEDKARLQGALNEWNTHNSDYSFGGQTEAEKDRVQMIQAVIKAGQGANLAEGLKTLTATGMTPLPRTDKGVKALIEDIPKTEQREAIALYSSAIKSGLMDAEQATAFVEERMQGTETTKDNKVGRSLVDALDGNTTSQVANLDSFLPSYLGVQEKANLAAFTKRHPDAEMTYALDGNKLKVSSGNEHAYFEMPPDRLTEFSQALAEDYNLKAKDTDFGRDMQTIRKVTRDEASHVVAITSALTRGIGGVISEATNELLTIEAGPRKYGNFLYNMSADYTNKQGKQMHSLLEDLEKVGVGASLIPVVGDEILNEAKSVINKLTSYFTGNEDSPLAPFAERLQERADAVFDTYNEASVRDGESLAKAVERQKLMADGERFGEVGKTLQKVEVPAEAPSPEKSSDSSLAKRIGLPEGHVKTLIKLESGNVGYDAVNPKSLAYGKYQFTTTGEVGKKNGTGLAYARKEGYKGEKGAPLRAWMLKNPKAQDEMFIKYTNDNLAGLKRRGIANPTAFHLYGSHQQGLKGFMEILSGKVNDERAINIKANLNGTGQDLEGKELADYWIKFWKAKIS